MLKAFRNWSCRDGSSIGSTRRSLLTLSALFAAALALLPASDARAHLNDNFARSDAAAIGNSWIEKSPGAFSLVSGQVAKQAVSSGYRDNVVYRPATEDVLNTEASVEFQITATPPGYPQLFVRLQSSTVATADVLDGYILFFEDTGTSAVLSRQTGSAYPTLLGTLTLSQPLNVNDRYRMRLSATGTNPVLLSAFIERLSGNIWQVIGQADASDSSAARIATAGSVGFGGYVESTYSFDNFARIDIGSTGTTNPAPTTVGLAPASVTAGESGLTLVVYGSGFTTDSIVRVNGSNRTTTYVSPSELDAAVTAADLASSGSRPITVFNPTPGGGTSGAQTLQVISAGNPAPTVTQLSPSSATAGGSAFTLTVTGSNFASGNVVRWNGSNRTTTFVSATQLQANITAADIATSGNASVTVFRSSDSVTSAAQSFTISTAPVTADFVDNFTRADSADIGNGWVEKTASAFSIVGGEAAKVSGGANDYRNNVVYRPAAENLLDVEAAFESRWVSGSIGYPQVTVRIQTATVATTNTLDAYLLYMNDSATQAVIARQRGSAYDTQLATFNLSAAINTSDRYRLRLRAVGTNPVVLNGYVERLAGSTWTIIGQGAFNDVAADRISTAGSVGFSGYTETSYRYDNFTRTNLSAPSPAPSLTSVSPASVSAGSAAINVTVTGSNFVPASVVRWNGSNRTTTYISATQLQAQISSADLAAQGTASVSVITPAPGGGTSSGVTFTVTAPANNPVPTLASLAPSAQSAGGAAFTLTVNGGNFVPSSVVRWSGASRTTTYISATQLQAQISAADIAAAGAATITVFNPAPAGGTTAGQTFTISAPTNPTPTVSALSPSTRSAGTGAFTLSITGTGFVNGSVVRWNGSNRATTFVSSTQLTAAITAADVTSTGTYNVTVNSPTPGGGTSGSQSFVVTVAIPTNPLPVLNQLNPIRTTPGSAGFNLTVTGTGFTNLSVVRWNGINRTTTFISSTELRAAILATDVATARLGSVTVSTPTPGGGISFPLTFFVQDGSLNLFFDGFNRANAAAVGNNWTEKNPDAFFIQDGRVASATIPNGGFQQDIMYRPSGEDRLNVESSVEFVRLPSQQVLDQANFPQLHARVQRSDLNQPYTLNSYIFFYDELSSQAMFAVTRSLTPGTRWECYIRAVTLSETPVVGQRYRLRFGIAGTTPVQLTGIVERYNGDSWDIIGSGNATHDASTQRDPSLYCDQTTMAPPITTAGGVGIAKWTSRTDDYDNYYWRDMTGGSPPAVSAIAPTATAAGSSAFQLVVNGSSFTSGSVVRWNGTARATTYVSPSELRAQISAADVAQAGVATVSVLAGESGQSTTGMTFEITAAGATENLVETFQRNDGDAIGNGWLEKTPSAFTLVSGRVQKQSTPGGDYRNNVVYRPVAENVRDVEASVELRFSNLASIGYPMVSTRVQTDTIGSANTMDGYILYVNDSSTNAVLARQRDNAYDTLLGSLVLTQPLNTTDTYRLRLRAIGSDTVMLTAFVERLNGSAWQVLGQATYNDTSSQRITQAGSVGFGGYIENSYSFDNFRRVIF